MLFGLWVFRVSLLKFPTVTFWDLSHECNRYCTQNVCNVQINKRTTRFHTCPWGACEEDQWRRSLHQVQLLRDQDQTCQPLPQFCHRLPYCSHLHTWGDDTVNVDCGGRTYEPVIGKTTHVCPLCLCLRLCVCVCVCVCVCLCVCVCVCV